MKYFAWFPIKMPDGQWIWRKWVCKTIIPRTGGGELEPDTIEYTYL